MKNFNSVKEIYSALLDGKKVTSNDYLNKSRFLQLDSTGVLIDADGNTVSESFCYDPSAWSIYEEPEEVITVYKYAYIFDLPYSENWHESTLYFENDKDFLTGFSKVKYYKRLDYTAMQILKNTKQVKL